MKSKTHTISISISTFVAALMLVPSTGWSASGEAIPNSLREGRLLNGNADLDSAGTENADGQQEIQETWGLKGSAEFSITGPCGPNEACIASIVNDKQGSGDALTTSTNHAPTFGPAGATLITGEVVAANGTTQNAAYGWVDPSKRLLVPDEPLIGGELGSAQIVINSLTLNAEHRIGLIAPGVDPTAAAAAVDSQSVIPVLAFNGPGRQEVSVSRDQLGQSGVFILACAIHGNDEPFPLRTSLMFVGKEDRAKSKDLSEDLGPANEKGHQKDQTAILLQSPFHQFLHAINEMVEGVRSITG